MSPHHCLLHYRMTVLLAMSHYHTSSCTEPNRSHYRECRKTQLNLGSSHQHLSVSSISVSVRLSRHADAGWVIQTLLAD